MTLPGEVILKTRVDLVDVAGAGRLIADWARQGAGRMVCALNVHMAMEAFDDPAFQAVVNGADLVVADGRPIVWACRLLGRREAVQVRGFDLTTALCALAQRERLKVGLYGGSPATVREVRRRLLEGYPGLDVAYAKAPPFRPLTPEEDADDIAAARGSRRATALRGSGMPEAGALDGGAPRRAGVPGGRRGGRVRHADGGASSGAGLGAAERTRVGLPASAGAEEALGPLRQAQFRDSCSTSGRSGRAGRDRRRDARRGATDTMGASIHLTGRGGPPGG